MSNLLRKLKDPSTAIADLAEETAPYCVRHHEGTSLWCFFDDPSGYIWVFEDEDGNREVTETETGMGVADFMATYFDSEPYGSVEEMLSAFDFFAEHYLPKPEKDYTGLCRIWVTYNYFVGTIGAPKDGYVQYGDGSYLTLSRKEAERWVEKAYKSTYILGHGEAGRPDYTVCKYE